MKAFFLNKPFVIEVRDIPVPELVPGYALVRVQTVSLCGTDIHAYHGRQALFDYPRVIGHEICGIVTEIREPANGIAVGDKVVAIPYISCGKCIACRKNKPGCCEKLTVTGVHRDGGLAEYVDMPTDYLVKVDAAMDPVRAAVIEPFAISAHAVHNGKVKADENVLVLGAGPIGMGAAEIAKSYGARLFIADTSPGRRRFAAETFGYADVLDPLAPGYREALSGLTNGDMPDTIIDTTGNGASMGACFQYLSHGGKVVFVGIYNGDMAINDVGFHKRQTELYGSRAATRYDFEYVISCMNEGKIESLKFVTHRANFDDGILDSFRDLMDKGPEVFKAVIIVDE